MAKSVHNDVLDAAWNIVKNNCNIMTACSAEPTTRAQAITDYALADVAMSSGDFAISDGAVSGRKITVAAKNAVPIDAGGSATHIALCDSTRLLYVTTCTPKTLQSGDTIDFPAWEDELRDPT
jgi:hypothetical protein